MNFWQLALEKMLSNLNIGEINVTFPDGEIKNFKGKKLGPIADVTFLTEKSIKDSILGGSLGFCEAFLDIMSAAFVEGCGRIFNFNLSLIGLFELFNGLSLFLICSHESSTSFKLTFDLF